MQTVNGEENPKFKFKKQDVGPSVVILATHKLLQSIPEGPCEIDPMRKFATGTPRLSYNTQPRPGSKVPSPPTRRLSKKPLILLASWHRYHAFRRGSKMKLVWMHLLSISHIFSPSPPPEPHAHLKGPCTSPQSGKDPSELPSLWPPCNHPSQYNFITRPELGVGGVETLFFSAGVPNCGRGSALGGRRPILINQ